MGFISEEGGKAINICGRLPGICWVSPFWFGGGGNFSGRVHFGLVGGGGHFGGGTMLMTFCPLFIYGAQIGRL